MFDRFLPALEDAVLTQWSAVPVFDTFTQRKLDPQDGREYWASNPFFQFCYVRQGTLEVESAHDSYTLHAGEILMIPPRMGVHVFSGVDTDLLQIQWNFLKGKRPGYQRKLRQEDLREWGLEGPSFASQLQIIKGLYAKRMGAQMQLIQDESLQTDSATEVLRTLQLLQILIEFLRMAREQNLMEEQLKQGNLQEVVRYSRNYIHANYHRELTVAEVASMLYLTPSYFSRLFRLVTGMNPLNYINQTRVSKACFLLEQEDQFKVQRIAEMVGFSSPQRFNAIFRKQMGMTPKQYRTRFLEEKKRLERESVLNWNWEDWIPDAFGDEWERVESIAPDQE